MAECVAPEFVRFVATARRAPELVHTAARLAAGLFGPSRRTEVVWVEGDNELGATQTGGRHRPIHDRGEEASLIRLQRGVTGFGMREE